METIYRRSIVCKKLTYVKDTNIITLFVRDEYRVLQGASQIQSKFRNDAVLLHTCKLDLEVSKYISNYFI